MEKFTILLLKRLLLKMVDFEFKKWMSFSAQIGQLLNEDYPEIPAESDSGPPDE